MNFFQIILLFNLIVLIIFGIIGFVLSKIRGIKSFGRKEKTKNILGSMTLSISILLLIMFWVWYIIDDNISNMFLSARFLSNADTIKYIAVIIVSLGTVLEILAGVNLGKSARINFPIEETRLITSGIYRVCRNPIVMGCFFLAFGLFLLNLNLLGLFMFITVLIGLNFKVNREAKDLNRRFGKEWDIYCTNVGKYFPKIFKKRRKLCL